MPKRKRKKEALKDHNGVVVKAQVPKLERGYSIPGLAPLFLSIFFKFCFFLHFFHIIFLLYPSSVLLIPDKVAYRSIVTKSGNTLPDSCEHACKEPNKIKLARQGTYIYAKDIFFRPK